MAGQHAILSPSGASKWMACPASLFQSKGLPDKTSEYAEEGTLAHTLAEYCLTNEVSAAEGARVLDIFDEGMVEHIQTYIDEIHDVLSTMREVEVFNVEEKLNLDRAYGVYGEDEQFGTADVLIIGDGVLHVRDLKYGMGVLVSAYENKQLMIYALGAYETYALAYDILRVVVAIHQPRRDSQTNYEFSVADLLAFKAEMQEKAKRAMTIYVEGDPKPEDFGPSENACRFCKAASTCKALEDKVMAEVSKDFDDMTADVSEEQVMEKVNASSNEGLAAKYAVIPLLEMWVSKVKEAVSDRLHAGEEVPGYKLVRGRQGNRKWTNESEVTEIMKKSFRLRTEEMYNLKLISPTQAAKLLKDQPKRLARINALVTRPEGAIAVAPESDKREAVMVSNDFNNLDIEDLI